MYIFLLIIVYIWFINLIIESLKISFLFIYMFSLVWRFDSCGSFPFLSLTKFCFHSVLLKPNFRRVSEKTKRWTRWVQKNPFCFILHSFDISLFVARTLIQDKWGEDGSDLGCCKGWTWWQTYCLPPTDIYLREQKFFSSFSLSRWRISKSHPKKKKKKTRQNSHLLSSTSVTRAGWRVLEP